MKSPTTSATKAAPYLLSRYDLQTELSTEGRRNAGRRTFLAQDTQTQERVVVKIIQLHQAIQVTDQWADLKLFERERQILEALSHPAIPEYKAAFQVEFEGVPSVVLVQTYLEADSLESLIQSGKRFSTAEIIGVAEQLLDILTYLHSQSPPVIHRDIKPSNILIGPTHPEASERLGDIYLIDFGAVHTDLTQESGTITIVGSYGYIPLEQFSGQATAASDLYSLGMTLIYLATGTHPADIAHVNGKIQLPTHSLDPSLVAWLERMTYPYLDRRFGSAQQALSALMAEESSQGRYLHLKPEGTDIELVRERDRLQISFTQPSIPTPYLTPIITALIAVLLFSQTGSIFFSVMVVFGLGYLYVAVRKCVSYLSTHLPANRRRRTVIEIERSQGIRIGTYYTGSPRKSSAIKSSVHRSSVRWEKPRARTQDIDLVAYNPGYQFNSYTEGNNVISQSDGHVPPELSIHSADLSIPIGHEKLSPAEFWWLGHELSDFLGLELQTIYPTPIVTVSAANSCGC